MLRVYQIDMFSTAQPTLKIYSKSTTSLPRILKGFRCLQLKGCWLSLISSIHTFIVAQLLLEITHMNIYTVKQRSCPFLCALIINQEVFTSELYVTLWSITGILVSKFIVSFVCKILTSQVTIIKSFCIAYYKSQCWNTAVGSDNFTKDKTLETTSMQGEKQMTVQSLEMTTSNRGSGYSLLTVTAEGTTFRQKRKRGNTRLEKSNWQKEFVNR